MIVVASIRNTGTHLLLGMLGIKLSRVRWEDPPERGINGHEIGYGHINPKHKHVFMPRVRNNTTIIPLRHPKVVARSWAQRGGCMVELVKTWELLVNEIDQHGPIYLPIDSPRRDLYLKHLNLVLDTDIQTDWAPVGSLHKNHALRHEDIKGPPIIDDLTDRISGFLGRLYG